VPGIFCLSRTHFPFKLVFRWPNEDNSLQAVAVDGYTKFSDINNMNYNRSSGQVMAEKKPGEVYDMP